MGHYVMQLAGYTRPFLRRDCEGMSRGTVALVAHALGSFAVAAYDPAGRAHKRFANDQRGGGPARVVWVERALHDAKPGDDERRNDGRTPTRCIGGETEDGDDPHDDGH